MGSDATATRRQRVAARAEQLRAMIRGKYPEARFKMVPGEERDSYHLLTYTAGDDVLGVIKLTGGLVTDILVEERFAIYVIPLPLADYEDGKAQKRVA